MTKCAAPHDQWEMPLSQTLLCAESIEPMPGAVAIACASMPCASVLHVTLGDTLAIAIVEYKKVEFGACTAAKQKSSSLFLGASVFSKCPSRGLCATASLQGHFRRRRQPQSPPPTNFIADGSLGNTYNSKSPLKPYVGISCRSFGCHSVLGATAPAFCVRS
jgi:hypothetical protein